MKKIILFILLIPTLLISCISNEKKIPKTDIEVATAFIRDVLDNNLNDAEQYVLKDEANQQYFEIIREQYLKKEKTELEKYKKAEILIYETSYVTDTVCVINYSNSYNKTLRNKVKLVRIDGKWLVDLKYTFSGNL